MGNQPLEKKSSCCRRSKGGQVYGCELPCQMCFGMNCAEQALRMLRYVCTCRASRSRTGVKFEIKARPWTMAYRLPLAPMLCGVSFFWQIPGFGIGSVPSVARLLRTEKRMGPSHWGAKVSALVNWWSQLISSAAKLAHTLSDHSPMFFFRPTSQRPLSWPGWVPT